MQPAKQRRLRRFLKQARIINTIFAVDKGQNNCVQKQNIYTIKFLQSVNETIVENVF